MSSANQGIEFTLFKSYIRLRQARIDPTKLRIKTVKIDAVDLRPKFQGVCDNFQYTEDYDLKTYGMIGNKIFFNLEFFQSLPFEHTKLLFRGDYKQNEYLYQFEIERYDQLVFKKEFRADKPFSFLGASEALTNLLLPDDNILNYGHCQFEWSLSYGVFKIKDELGEAFWYSDNIIPYYIGKRLVKAMTEDELDIALIASMIGLNKLTREEFSHVYDELGNITNTISAFLHEQFPQEIARIRRLIRAPKGKKQEMAHYCMSFLRNCISLYAKIVEVLYRPALEWYIKNKNSNLRDTACIRWVLQRSSAMDLEAKNMTDSELADALLKMPTSCTQILYLPNEKIEGENLSELQLESWGFFFPKFQDLRISDLYGEDLNEVIDKVNAKLSQANVFQMFKNQDDLYKSLDPAYKEKFWRSKSMCTESCFVELWSQLASSLSNESNYLSLENRIPAVKTLEDQVYYQNKNSGIVITKLKAVLPPRFGEEKQIVENINLVPAMCDTYFKFNKNFFIMVQEVRQPQANFLRQISASSLQPILGKYASARVTTIEAALMSVALIENILCILYKVQKAYFDSEWSLGYLNLHERIENALEGENYKVTPITLGQLYPNLSNVLNSTASINTGGLILATSDYTVIALCYFAHETSTTPRKSTLNLFALSKPSVSELCKDELDLHTYLQLDEDYDYAYPAQFPSNRLTMFKYDKTSFLLRTFTKVLGFSLYFINSRRQLECAFTQSRSASLFTRMVSTDSEDRLIGHWVEERKVIAFTLFSNRQIIILKACLRD